MTTSAHDSDRDQTETPVDGAPAANRDRRAGTDPRATSHPTGDQQAAENAENEPAG